MSREELKPCPFCGGRFVKYIKQPGTTFAEFDHKKGCIMYDQSIPDVEWEAWNRRSIPSTDNRGLRKAILAEYDEYPSGSPEVSQLVDGKWYVSRWGCDQLDHVLDAVSALSLPQRDGKLLSAIISCGSHVRP